MTTLEINESPSPAVDAAPESVVVTDSKGRKLTIAEPDILAPYRLVKIIGAEAAENRVYMGMIFPLMYLTAIDGEKVFPFNTEREIEALIKQLGHHGVKALRQGVEEHFSVKSDEDQAAAVKK